MIDDDGQSLTDMEAVRFPLPSPHSDHPETAENRHPDRESNRASGQSPATRSSPPFPNSPRKSIKPLEIRGIYTLGRPRMSLFFPLHPEPLGATSRGQGISDNWTGPHVGATSWERTEGHAADRCCDQKRQAAR